MRVVTKDDGTTDSAVVDPFRGLSAAPTVPRPTTLSEERIKRRRQLHIGELTQYILEYVRDRYGNSAIVDMRALETRLTRYVEANSWSHDELDAVLVDCVESTSDYSRESSPG